MFHPYPNVNANSDLYNHIKRAEAKNDYNQLKELFNLITAEELNKYTNTDPSSTLLIAILDYFDINDRYTDLINGLFHLRNVDVQKVNINAQNLVTQKTALITAADRGLFQFVQTLIFWNADPHIITFHQTTAFSCACKEGHVEVAEYLSRYVTREELELRGEFSNKTIKEEMELRLVQIPNDRKTNDLLKIIFNIEMRHLIQKRIAEQEEEEEEKEEQEEEKIEDEEEVKSFISIIEKLNTLLD